MGYSCVKTLLEYVVRPSSHDMYVCRKVLTRCLSVKQDIENRSRRVYLNDFGRVAYVMRFFDPELQSVERCREVSPCECILA